MDGWYHYLPRPPIPTKQRWVPTRAPVTTPQDVDGVLSFSGTLTTIKLFTKSIDGSLSFSGDLTRQTNKNVLAGVLTFTGTAVKQTNKLLSGVLSFTGVLTKQTNKVLSGALSFTGDLAKRTNRALTGVLSFVGTVATVFIPGAGPGIIARGQKFIHDIWGTIWNDE